MSSASPPRFPAAAAPVVVWDEHHLKALLRLPRFPPRLIQAEPWRSWIEEHGGLSAVHAHLCACELTPHQHELLDVILNHPYAGVQMYADLLSISPPTYFNRLRELVTDLVNHLNAWDRGRPPGLPRQVSNLPLPHTDLVGARQTLRAVVELLGRPAVRLVTLTGCAGIGKSRLAMEVALNLSWEAASGDCICQDGLCFVPLSALADPAQLHRRLAQALGLQEAGQRLSFEMLADYLGDRNILMILDGFEHLASAAPALTELLAVVPRLKLLVTSREALRVYGEHEFPVPPLDDADSACLFLQLRPRENSAEAAEIGRLLQGVPLAIELVAGSNAAPQEIISRLDLEAASPLQSVLGLAANRGERPTGALQAALSLSYACLPPASQALLRRLGVFGGGFTLAAAAAVNIADVTADAEKNPVAEDCRPLVDDLLARCLLVLSQRGDEAPPRYDLPAAVGEYVRRLLVESGESETVHRRHAAYYLALAERLEPEISGQSNRAHLDQLKQEQDNFDAALQWAVEHGEAEIALRLTAALWKFWQAHGDLRLGRQWLAHSLAMSHSADLEALLVTNLWGAGWLACQQNELEQAAGFFEAGLALAQKSNDRRAVGLTRQGLGEIAHYIGEWERAAVLFEQSLELFREVDDTEEIAWSLDHISRLAFEQGDYGRARAAVEECLQIFQKLGHKWGLARALARLGTVMLHTGELGRAAALLEESLMLTQELGNKQQLAWRLDEIGRVRLAQRKWLKAGRAFQESLELHWERRHYRGTAFTLLSCAELELRRNRPVQAIRLGGAAQAIFEAEVPALPVPARKRIADLLAGGRASLDEAVIAAAWADGQTLPVEQIVAEVLSPKTEI